MPKAKYPVTPDGRYFVVRGRLWRCSNPHLSKARRAELVKELMQARRAKGVAMRSGDTETRETARKAADAAKVALGERGPVWWTDGEPDWNRHMAANTPYAGWFSKLPTLRKSEAEERTWTDALKGDGSWQSGLTNQRSHLNIATMSTQLPKATVYSNLGGRTVVITGGATGIGAAFVAAFASQGAKVCFLDVQAEAAAKLIDKLSGKKHVPRFLDCDLTDIRALKSAFKTIARDFLEVDVLVNNAANDDRHKTDEVTPEFWDKAIAVNLRHQFFAAQAVLPVMRKQGHGSIINMSSIAWMIPSTNQAVYVAAKAAVVGLTRTMAHEEGVHNIRINAVLPGAILTERQERLWLTAEYKAKVLESQALKRLILPEEVANLVLFLASDDSSAITSQGFVIDAGWV